MVISRHAIHGSVYFLCGRIPVSKMSDQHLHFPRFTAMVISLHAKATVMPSKCYGHMHPKVCMLRQYNSCIILIGYIKLLLSQNLLLTNTRETSSSILSYIEGEELDLVLIDVPMHTFLILSVMAIH